MRTNPRLQSLDEFLDALDNLKSNLNERIDSRNLVISINGLLENQAASFDCSKISNLLNSLSDLGLKKSDLLQLNLEDLSKKIDTSVSRGSGWDLIRIVNGFARLGYEKSEVVLSDNFFAKLKEKYVSKSGQTLALHGMSFLGYKADNCSGSAKEYMHMLVKSCKKNFPDMNARGKATFIHSLARMEMTDILIGMKDQLNEKIGESLAELSSDSAYSILQARMFCDLIEQDPMIHDGLCQNLSKLARCSAETYASSLQKKVRQNLPSELQFQEEYPLYQVYGTTIRPLDFLITNGEENVGVEVDGPSHFLLNNSPSIKTEQRNHINDLAMKRLGLNGRYVVLSHFSINEHKSDLRSYLASLLPAPQLKLESKPSTTEIVDLKDLTIDVPDEVKEQVNETRETLEEFYARLRAASGHKEVKSLISKFSRSGRLNETDDQGNNLIHLCSRDGGNNEILMVLLNRNIDINHRNHEGRTPLHLAAESGNPSSIRELLSLGADFEVLDSGNKSPIDLAVESASRNPENPDRIAAVDLLSRNVGSEKLRSLIERLEVDDSVKSKLKTANKLFTILDSKNIGLISRLVLRGDLNFEIESVRDSMLSGNILNDLINYKLSEKGKESEAGEAALLIFEELSSRGIEVGAQTKRSLSAMVSNSLTELFGKITRIEELPQIRVSKFSSYVDCVNKLMESGNQEAVCKMIEIGSRSSFKAKEIRSFNEFLINQSAEKGFEDVVKKLHQLDSSLIHIQLKGNLPFPLYSAAKNGDLGMVDTLIKLGCNVNQTLSENETAPLQIAIRNGYADVAKLLIENGANVGHVSKVLGGDRNEDTLPIVLAVSTPLPEITKIILDDKKFKMPERIKDKLAKRVVARRDFDDLDILMQFGEIDVNKVYQIPTLGGGSIKSTLLMIATKSNDFEMVEALINHGAEVEKVVEYAPGNKICSIELTNGSGQIFDLLISKAIEQRMVGIAPKKSPVLTTRNSVVQSAKEAVKEGNVK